MHRLVVLVGILVAPGAAAAQDSLPRRDTVPVELPPVVVTVRRADERLERIPGAVSILDSAALRSGRPLLGPDEVLGLIPGLHVANRYNFSLDQRLSVRGFGARANFGVRGVRVLLDGVPQTLPDGQTQLTNVDWGTLRRVEVFRGPGALYGNASGGIVALESGDGDPGVRARVQAGAFGLRRWLASGGTRAERLGLSASVGGFDIDGFRQHSAAQLLQASARADYALSDRNRIAVHLAHADAPQAQNPGALTAAELAARRDSAAANNILRGADKDARQQQLAATFAHRGRTLDIDASVFGLVRSLENPLATATWVSIDRLAGGTRAVATYTLGVDASAPRITAGVDVQEMRDDRANYRTIDGERTDSVLLDQRERVGERGGFVQAAWPVAPRLMLTAGVRRDAVRFRVDDRHLSDGADNTGRRTLAAWSANAGISATVGVVTAYATAATAFETPTSTELANAPGVTGGFNPDLGPQRTLSTEVGMRGRIRVATWSAAAFLGRVRDAIVQFEEVGGRAFFRNAGRLRQDGVELAGAAAPARGVAIEAAYTWARLRFGEYSLVTTGGTETLDGRQVPGVPEHSLRFALGVHHSRISARIEHAIASRLFADDRNSVAVPGWGVTDVVVSGESIVGTLAITPSAGIRNLFDREYVGSVTVNGAGGRVFEPAPGRHGWVGVEIRYSQLRAASPDPGR